MFSQLFSKKLQKSAFFFVLGLFGENIWWVWGRIRGFAVSIDNESEKSTVALLFIFFSVNCSLLLFLCYVRQGFDKNLYPHAAYGRKSYRI